MVFGKANDKGFYYRKINTGVKTPTNNLIRAKIKIDRGRSGLTWFETGAYAKTTLMKLDVNHMQQ